MKYMSSTLPSLSAANAAFSAMFFSIVSRRFMTSATVALLVPVDDFFLVVFFLVSVPGVVSAPSVTAVCSKFSSVIVSCSRSRCRC